MIDFLINEYEISQIAIRFVENFKILSRMHKLKYFQARNLMPKFNFKRSVCVKSQQKHINYKYFSLNYDHIV